MTDYVQARLRNGQPYEGNKQYAGAGAQRSCNRCGTFGPQKNMRKRAPWGMVCAKCQPSTMTIKVHDVAAGDLPKLDTDILIWRDGSDEAELGALLQQSRWVDAGGAPIDAVTHWADMPKRSAT